MKYWLVNVLHACSSTLLFLVYNCNWFRLIQSFEKNLLFAEATANLCVIQFCCSFRETPYMRKREDFKSSPFSSWLLRKLVFPKSDYNQRLWFENLNSDMAYDRNLLENLRISLISKRLITFKVRKVGRSNG